ncbi:hypothetical protein KZX37_11670 [Microbacterium sp. EYE_5]|nr:hypothetical protein [Microbacterium sp. EYE_382]MCK6086099.1 hypothetical protein [Microbacterium sp. EYE_384]MCK6124403.1 hypothetical protein [Microbacterium sp. EYE_80]MCK6127312.1 hypothetical protein [Microbacterium sp. EYE_79]MCK6141783.1 hypothetical protein [Microbacterium sp. EYE_39]MCK6218958.1 hypothetical protein [Microbacterium sp. EYE_5]MCK6228284.1 hypothetical protein [Microbacterium sp. EYE_77]MCK6247818.1 hypothetical protein [Microbacterium sp. EYE_78]
MRRASSLGSVPTVILVDGRSGAGKSTFAAMLAASFDEAALVALDEIYPGWDGLRQGADTALTQVIRPVLAGRAGEWETWDWARGIPSGRRRVVGPAPVLIVEGAGVLTPASAAVADVRVWLDAPARTRRERALRRDGDAYRPHWERWAAQEEDHLRAHGPRDLADVVLDLP